MSMLAGPRRKQKVINLRAKNSEWSNDTNKFGQRMLEKMGWSSGKGLGAKENGMVEHVVARYKNDERGLGFEDKNDQWTKHEDDFDALLANLSNGDNNEDKLHSGISLEIKSKKSKARVHYHKYTRGKDLTRYSEKDLANIFGKKTFKNKEKVEEICDVNQTTEQVFTEKGSMEDYFKNKLAALKSKNKLSVDINTEKEDYEADYSFRGFSDATNETEEDQDSVGFQGFLFDNASSNENGHINEESVVNETKKRKKKKKSKEKLDEQSYHELHEDNSEICLVENTEEQKPAKKKKSKKNKQETDGLEEVENLKIAKSKIETQNAVETNIEEDYHVPKKKKKRKNKDYEL